MKDNDNFKTPFVYLKSFDKNHDFLQTKKIYYKYQINRPIDNIKKEDYKIINDIYQKYLDDRIIIDSDLKKIVRRYFGKSSSIGKLIVCNYSKVSEFINCNGLVRKLIIYDKLDFYLPLSLSIETRRLLNEKGIYRLSDLYLQEIEVNQFDYANISRYMYDVDKYYLNDEIFYSILDIGELELFQEYLDYNSYLLLSKSLCVSPTEARARIYTIIKKCLKYFDSVDGVRFFDLLFSKNYSEISINEIEMLFPKCHRIFLYFVRKGYFNAIELINSLDIIKIKWYN